MDASVIEDPQLRALNEASDIRRRWSPPCSPRRVPRRDRRQLLLRHHPAPPSTTPDLHERSLRSVGPGGHRHPEPGAPREGVAQWRGTTSLTGLRPKPAPLRGPGRAESWCGPRPRWASRSHVLRRPRQLQDGQRHLRPHHRRPAHPAGGPSGWSRRSGARTTVARVGGDEFAILLPGLVESALHQPAGRAAPRCHAHTVRDLRRANVVTSASVGMPSPSEARRQLPIDLF